MVEQIKNVEHFKPALPCNRIEQVHLQITRNCNLRCYFCGQWGKRGFFSDASGTEMQLVDWEKVIEELITYREKTGVSPYIMVWGGEPLVSPWFDDIVELLHKEKFLVGMVTNGVLLDRHKEVINKAVSWIYLSLDGPPQIHDRIRGKGIFEKVLANLEQINGPEISVMSVVTGQLIPLLPEFLDILEDTKIGALFLQDMIGLKVEEITDYKVKMQEIFGIQAEYIESWENEGRLQFHEELDCMLKQIDRDKYHFKIVPKQHYEKQSIGNQYADMEYCLSPFRHIHVTWNGNVTFCTDFYDFKAGSVKEQGLEAIFTNENSEKFRRMIIEGKCATCNHCSWRENREYFCRVLCTSGESGEI